MEKDGLCLSENAFFYLDTTGLIFWSVTYLLICFESIRYRDKYAVCMPYFTGCLNFAWGIPRSFSVRRVLGAYRMARLGCYHSIYEPAQPETNKEKNILRLFCFCLHPRILLYLSAEQGDAYFQLYH